MKKMSDMKTTIFKRSMLFTAMMIAAGQASAITYNLCAGTASLTMPDGTTSIAMWGYGIDTGGACNATIPGPRLTVPPGDATLTVNLRNTLSVPVSIVVPGLSSTEAPAPATFTDAQGRTRARSLVKETANGATVAYSFNARTGTFLYHSGSHPAVQVQMGLYGAVTSDEAVGEAYPDVPYNTEVVMLYSEIDPALHAAVDSGTYGTAAYPSTIGYSPTYFLVNGAPYTTGAANLDGGAVGQRTLIRFLNAGLESHAPTLLGAHMSVVAEYGNPYPYGREQYSLLLAAQQTRDAVIDPSAAGTLALYDRRLRLTNSNTAGPGGLMSILAVSAGGGAGSAPLAVDDSITTDEEVSALNVNVAANDTDADGDLNVASVAITAQALHGTAVGNADGTVNYTPAPNYNGADSFTYTIRDLANNISNAATVSVAVNAVNDTPVAAGESYSTNQGAALNVALPGVLSNDSDVDGDSLTAVLDTTTTSGSLTFNGNGSFSYTPNAGFSGSDSFTYHANDGAANSAGVTVAITVVPAVNQAPAAVNDYATVRRNTRNSSNTVTVNVIANDTDSDGSINAASVVITTQPRKGGVVNNGDGTVTYRPAAGKTGSDAFGYRVMDNQGALSNVGTVRINIVR
ncbi:MAG TPA: Ig-like domain-containing protein [Gammaproteobacteria bacterium]